MKQYIPICLFSNLKYLRATYFKDQQVRVFFVNKMKKKQSFESIYLLNV